MGGQSDVHNSQMGVQSVQGMGGVHSSMNGIS